MDHLRAGQGLLCCLSWLIKKFIDRDAKFLFVPAERVMEVAGQEQAIPFDVPGVEFGHHGKECSVEAIRSRQESIVPDREEDYKGIDVS